MPSRPTGRTRAGRAACAVILASACAGAPPPAVPAACPPSGPREAPRLPFPVEGDAERGATLFEARCLGCHAPTMEARAPDAPPHAPRLDCDAWLAVADDAYLYRAINRGPGVFGHGGAPPLGEQLAPRDVADLVAFLRAADAR